MRIGKLRKIILIGALLIVGACTTTQKTLDPIYISLMSDLRNTDFLSTDANVEKLYLELGVVPGGLYGNVKSRPKWYVHLNPGSITNFDFANFENNFLRYAKANNNRYDSLKIDPIETKIARVSTFGLDRDTGKRYGSELLDNESRVIMLAYFESTL